MKKISILFLSTVLVMYTTSCEDFLDINKSPNVPADAPVELVLPAAITSTGGVVGGNYAILGGLWSQYYAQNNGSNQYKNMDAFNLQTTNYNLEFSELYAGALNDYEFVRRKAKATENWSVYLVATVMQAYTFQVLADIYDEIPFSEALKGDELRAPRYESGQAVYDSLILRINDALGKDFDNVVAGVRTSRNPGTSDFVFGEAGATDAVVDESIENWTRFANTLKLKIYVRQIYARPDVAGAGIQALYDQGAQFLTQDAGLAIFEDIPSKSNPLYEQDQRQLNTNANLRASRTLMSYLQVNNDGRINIYYLPGNAGHKPLDQGNYVAPSTVIVPASLSRARILATDPVLFISEEESYFLQAEAAARGFGSDDAESLFNLGVETAFARFDLAPVAYTFPAGGTLEEKVEAIIVQKWVALAGTHQGIEGFFERNRTGYPRTSAVYSGIANGSQNPDYIAGQFVYPKEGVTSGLFAKRLLFPDTETRRNPNTPAQKGLTEKVWWDTK
jgi:hypothetical protein